MCQVTNIASLHREASRLVGVLGRYSARLQVAGVPGSLVKCELGTTHTYLVFRPFDRGAAEDVVVIALTPPPRHNFAARELRLTLQPLASRWM